MDVEQAKDYMEKFERQIIIPYYERLNDCKRLMISAKLSKLSKTEFGQFVGQNFRYRDVLAIDYYGLNKVSSKFSSIIKSSLEKGIQVRSINSPVVYFASIRLKDIADLSPNLVYEFAHFKDHLVQLRGFKTKS